MIPEIGAMISVYLVTRMLESLLAPNRKAIVIARAFAVITIIIAAIVTFDLVLRGTTGLDMSDLQ